VTIVQIEIELDNLEELAANPFAYNKDKITVALKAALRLVREALRIARWVHHTR
jgi:hypothetical protein